ncbi:sensor domain-containing protein [Massilia glaciei]|uniref:GGDEF domain-containing protein n=1 Tax=Massilia glaciei TaxID=1524097 RepID=A0A2U2HJI5_9BURK|nr:EAL domain-containing protein [Massilia glaciei]PWF47612.1 GGDEF domain-containing protein [Massilia glaciei]
MPAPGDVPAAAFLVGPTGEITSWNAACERLLGYAADDILLHSITSILPEAVREQFAIAMQAWHSDAEQVDAQVIHADGKVLPFNLIFVPQYSQSGRFDNYSVIIGAPVARGEETEHELIGRVPLKKMVDFLAGAFYVLNQDALVVMWNKRVEVATKRTPDQLDGIPALALFPAGQQAQVAEKIGAAFTHGDVQVVEADLLATDGSSTPYLLTGSRFEVDERLYLCGMGLDISERRKQEVQLRLRERALHASSNGIVITGCVQDNHPIEYVNRAFERITGYRADEVIGRDARFMAAPEHDPDERSRLRQALKDNREIKVLFRNLKKNGELFWNDLTVTPVEDEKGETTHFIGVINDVTDAIVRTSTLEHALNHDVLTGVASRSLMWDRLEQALHVAQRNKSLVAAVLVDLDNFKDINDTLGHDGGDEVLRVVARRLQSSVRDSDTVARLGGDEFVLVLHNQPSLRYTLRMIDRVRQELSKPAMVLDKEVDIRASMGVSIYPHDGASAIELIQAADVAMYHAKAAGRNDVHFFSLAMRRTSEAAQELEAGIRGAIEKDQLFLAFQPRVCLRTGTIVGAESLLRWRHPQQGILLPGAFIPAAEESGLIVAVGEWVLEHTCLMLQHLAALGHDKLALSMNVSFRELTQKNYVAQIGKKLSAAGLAPGLFALEVKESILMRNPQLSREIFGATRELGIKLTIDDFGGGSSSLANLHELAVNHIKIPHPVIEHISAQNEGADIARTMIAIGHNLNIRVIADGVETGGQLSFLKQYDCDEMQGNYFCPPVGMLELERLLGSGAHPRPPS